MKRVTDKGTIIFLNGVSSSGKTNQRFSIAFLFQTYILAFLIHQWVCL